ncbi:MAG: 50S ribosomal protein L13 [Deltaproteobacteria bacterium]|nr:50S ribosomal protein L13 [Deltaproteobacteria bacterium]
MLTKMTKHFSEKEIKRDWYLIDAKDKILGKVAVKAAEILQGKNKVEFTPNSDVGDFVIIINASKVKVTGKKLTEKMYYRHTGYFGNLKEFNLKYLLEKHPERVISLAVKNMLPKGTLGHKMLKKLKVYANDKHPHSAQRPSIVSL